MKIGRYTLTGRVVYPRKPHVFSGRDMTRVAIAVNNNNTGSFLNWRAVLKIASRNVAQLSPTKVILLSDGTSTRDQLILLVRILQKLGGQIPIYGWMVDLAADFFFLADELTR